MLKVRTGTSNTGKQSRVVTAVLDGNGFRVFAKGDVISTPPIKISLPFIDVTCPVCNTPGIALKKTLKKVGTVRCVICRHRYDPRDGNTA